LDVRRAKALGDLARTQTALDLFHQGHPAGQDADGLPAAREVIVHAHFDASTIGKQTVFGPTGRMEEGQRLLLLDQVKDWCADSRTKVTVKPVIDLNATLSTPAYEVPDRIREQVILRIRRRNLGSHATPDVFVVWDSISSSFSAGVRNSCRLRGRELSSTAMLSSNPGP
jgi:hypothetical protein